MFKSIIAAAALIITATTATAAIQETNIFTEVTDMGTTTVQAFYETEGKNNFVTVVYKGPITWDAAEQTVKWLEEAHNKGFDDINLRMTSNGGVAIAGVIMADAARNYSVDTHARDYCLSACAIAFLGGVDRKIHPGSKIGFHAIYTMEETGPVCSDVEGQWTTWFKESFNSNWNYANKAHILDIQVNYCNPWGFIYFFENDATVTN